MDVSAFDFHLPEELIAQEPPAQRGQSRLLVVHRDTGRLEHASFHELPRFLTPGDLLVVNDTRVFPARLLGRRAPSGGAVECLLIRKLPTSSDRQLAAPNEHGEPAPNQSAGPGSSRPPEHAPTSGVGSSEIWEALMHPGQKLKPGAAVVFEGSGARIHGEVLEQRFFGRRTIRLWTEQGDLADAINRLGHIPLPPYIRREDRPEDRERYQTVYAHERGSIAAPTAGLHFTSALLQDLAAAGVEQARLTLHVGYGTFKPVRVERVEDHAVDAEAFTVSAAAAEQMSRARRSGRRIIAVGTTTVRALESLTVTTDGRVLPQQGETSLFIHPGHRFRIVNGLITNFHLPKSSLLMLVSAFAGHEQVMAAYRAAVTERYRFYSYGDAMLVL